MRNYIIKRLLLIPVTLFGILLINFGIVQLAPGGPVEYMLAQYKGMDTAATGNINAGMPNINEQKYQGAKGVPDDLVKELEKPARDPRSEMPQPILRGDILEMKDLKEGMILKGTVRNVIDFGAFVDIGVHQDGLVHISQMSDKFIKHPLDVVSVGDIVTVKVMSVDLAKKRIQLTMKGIN